VLTSAIIVVGIVRILGSLPVLRWPFAGGLLAVLVDLSDLVLLGLLSPGFGVDNYQSFDKYVDQVYMVAFLVVALRWTGIERNVAIGLYVFRLAGFVAFEITGERFVLLAFPNLFELWFLVVAAVHARHVEVRWTRLQLAAVLGLALVVKEIQEWAIHGARLFDSLYAIDVIRDIWRWLTGG
jgi:hypothetical protein